MIHRILRAGILPGFAVAIVLLWQLDAASAESRHKKTADQSATATRGVAASQPPAFSVPVEPLGFYPPGEYYKGQREALVSLDFLDEDHLLFTFRAPGLIHRTQFGTDERQIRAVVLSLPDGSVDAEALWSLHDTDRYIWMGKGGHFLLRDGDTLKEGDAGLRLTPLLQFPGPVLWMQMDPTQQYMVTDSLEPKATQQKPGDVGSPVTAQTSVTTDDANGGDQRDTVLRILRRESGKVMLVSRVRNVVQLPISPDGYLEALPASSGHEWVLNLNYFKGGDKVLTRLDSTCQPPLTFLAQDTALANTCAAQGGRKLVAVSMEGRRLWDAPCPPTQVWPLLVMAADGSRVARETLTVSHPVDAFSPLSFSDVTGQLVEVYDSAEGKRQLLAPADPVLDGGGNVAISPSGKLVAVLNAGAIQIYDLSGATNAASDAPHQH